jgi:hypothetical protein
MSLRQRIERLEANQDRAPAPVESTGGLPNGLTLEQFGALPVEERLAIMRSLPNAPDWEQTLARFQALPLAERVDILRGKRELP